MGAPKGNQYAKGHDGSNAGRPRKEVSEKLIYDLAKIHCTDEEIASMNGISVDRLVCNYAEILKEGREEGKACLRRQQMRLVEDCNSTQMAIWLGKVYLKQKEEVHVTTQELPVARIPTEAISMKKDND